MSARIKMKRKPQNLCWAIWDPFAKTIWAPSVRRNRRRAIEALLAEETMPWNDCKKNGWKVVRVRVTLVGKKPQ